MKRWVLLVVVVAMAVLLTGCGGGNTGSAETNGGDTGAATGGTSGESETSSLPDHLTAMPTDGPGESASLAALPGQLEMAKQMHTAGGSTWPDISAVEPRFTAYILQAVAGNNLVLFEVHADGVVHGLYDATEPATATNLFVQDATYAGNVPTADAQSSAEKAAVEAAAAIMTEAFPGETVVVKIANYRFSYVVDDTLVLTIEMMTDGTVGSVGS